VKEWQASPSELNQNALHICLIYWSCPLFRLLFTINTCRTASAIIESQGFNAAQAVMLVNSFSQSGEWFQDHAAFVSLMPGNASEIENFTNS
jgi:hypothetical protein